MGKEPTFTMMELNTKAIGKMINKMAKVSSNGLMAPSTRGCTRKAKKMVTEYLNGRMDHNMKANSL